MPSSIGAKRMSLSSTIAPTSSTSSSSSSQFQHGYTNSLSATLPLTKSMDNDEDNYDDDVYEEEYDDAQLKETQGSLDDDKRDDLNTSSTNPEIENVAPVEKETPNSSQELSTSNETSANAEEKSWEDELADVKLKKKRRKSKSKTDSTSLSSAPPLQRTESLEDKINIDGIEYSVAETVTYEDDAIRALSQALEDAEGVGTSELTAEEVVRDTETNDSSAPTAISAPISNPVKADEIEKPSLMESGKPNIQFKVAEKSISPVQTRVRSRSGSSSQPKETTHLAATQPSAAFKATLKAPLLRAASQSEDVKTISKLTNIKPSKPINPRSPTYKNEKAANVRRSISPHLQTRPASASPTPRKASKDDLIHLPKFQSEILPSDSERIRRLKALIQQFDLKYSTKDNHYPAWAVPNINEMREKLQYVQQQEGANTESRSTIQRTELVGRPNIPKLSLEKHNSYANNTAAEYKQFDDHEQSHRYTEEIKSPIRARPASPRRTASYKEMLNEYYPEKTFIVNNALQQHTKSSLQKVKEQEYDQNPSLRKTNKIKVTKLHNAIVDQIEELSSSLKSVWGHLENHSLNPKDAEYQRQYNKHGAHISALMASIEALQNEHIHTTEALDKLHAAYNAMQHRRDEDEMNRVPREDINSQFIVSSLQKNIHDLEERLRMKDQLFEQEKRQLEVQGNKFEVELQHLHLLLDQYKSTGTMNDTFQENLKDKLQAIHLDAEVARRGYTEKLQLLEDQLKQAQEASKRTIALADQKSQELEASKAESERALIAASRLEDLLRKEIAHSLEHRSRCTQLETQLEEVMGENDRMEEKLRSLEMSAKLNQVSSSVTEKFQKMTTQTLLLYYRRKLEEAENAVEEKADMVNDLQDQLHRLTADQYVSLNGIEYASETTKRAETLLHVKDAEIANLTEALRTALNKITEFSTVIGQYENEASDLRASNNKLNSSLLQEKLQYQKVMQTSQKSEKNVQKQDDTLQGSQFAKFMLESFQGDYLRMGENSQFLIRLHAAGEEKILFSDSVIRIDHHNRSQSRTLVVSERAIYVCTDSSTAYQLKRRVAFPEITKISLSRHNSKILVLHVTDNYDYLLEVSKRSEFMYHLLQLYPTFTGKALPYTFSERMYVTDRDKFHHRDVFVTSDQQLQLGRSTILPMNASYDPRILQTKTLPLQPQLQTAQSISYQY